MEQASKDEINAAAAEEQSLPATPEETSTSPEVTPEETPEVATLPVEEVQQGVPQARVDQIVAEKRGIQGENESLKGQLAQVKELEGLGYSLKDIKDYIATNAGSSQELDSVKSKRENAELRQTVQGLKEKSEIDEYLLSNPTHKTFSKALTGLKKAYPNKSYDQLVVENFSSIPVAKPKVKVETGRGSIEESISDTISDNKFSALPLKEQRAYLKSHGGLFPKGGRLDD